MRNKYVNICHNPRFTIWPWGTSGFAGVASTVNFGKTAARWFLQTTSGGGDTVAVSRGTNADTTKYDKWLRNRPNMTIDVSTRATNTTMRVRQFLEGYQDFGQNVIAMTVIASGPAGSTFYFGAGDNYGKITTLGNDSAGDPILVTATEFFLFDDPVYEYLRVTPFESPSSTGVFRLHHVQCEVLMDTTKVSDLELRTDWEEWELLSRYITPIRQGMFATGAGATSIRLPVVAPAGGWRVTPSIATEGRAAAYNITLNSGGTVINNASPTYSIASNPTANNLGVVLALGGFTTTTSASPYVIGPETVPICYLNADYF